MFRTWLAEREPRPGRPHGKLQVRLAYHLERWASAHEAEDVVAGFSLELSELFQKT